MSNSPANGIQTSARKRLLGFDLFRFLGVFIIFAGHNFFFFAPQFTETSMLYAPHWFTSLFYPGFWYSMMLLPIPVFIVMHAFNTIGRPLRPSDWARTKKRMAKYLVFAYKWCLVAFVLAILFPHTFAVTLGKITGVDSLTLGQKIELFFENLFFANVGGMGFKGFTASVAINWTTIGFVVAAVMIYILRPFFQTASIKSIRIVTFLVVLWMNILPGVRTIANDVLLTHPDSLIALFFSNFQPLAAQGMWSVEWDNFWVPMLMMGGWYAVDREFREKVLNMSWGKTIVIAAAGFCAFLILDSRWGLIPQTMLTTNGNNATSYWNGGYLPGSIALWLIFDKLNYSIKDDSAVGRFALNWGPDNVGIMLISYVFGTVPQGTILLPVLAWVASFCHNHFTAQLAFTAFNLVYFVLLTLVVHVVRTFLTKHKVPFFKGLFDWDDIKSFDNEIKEADKKAAPGCVQETAQIKG